MGPAGFRIVCGWPLGVSYALILGAVVVGVEGLGLPCWTPAGPIVFLGDSITAGAGSIAADRTGSRAFVLEPDPSRG